RTPPPCPRPRFPAPVSPPPFPRPRFPDPVSAHTDLVSVEIHHDREEFARECGYDVDVMFAKMREREKRSNAKGWKVVTLSPRSPVQYEAPEPDETCILREAPPKN
ncbi:MAG: hypothetical protein RL088_442, partial [Verrucomicrobiota bacterium]